MQWIRDIDTIHKYTDGGLGTCETDSAALKLKEAAKIITDPVHRIYDAKRGFDILPGGKSIDVWAAEVRYHLSCYRRFDYTGNDTLKQDIEDTKIHDFVFNNFLADVYESVVRGSNAHLLSELLKDWLSLCLEKKIESKINHTHHLKTKKA